MRKLTPKTPLVTLTIAVYRNMDFVAYTTFKTPPNTDEEGLEENACAAMLKWVKKNRPADYWSEQWLPCYNWQPTYEWEAAGFAS